MTSPNEAPTPAQAARRQLVRGAFAAPALLTVYSGSALAMSSAKRCLVNQTSTPMMLPVSDTLDLHLRVQLRQTGGGLSPISYWIRGSDLQTFKRPSTTAYISGTQWQPFDVNTNTAGTLAETEPPGQVESNPPKFAALRFDAHGNIVGVGLSHAANQSALAGTCWHSVAPSL